MSSARDPRLMTACDVAGCFPQSDSSVFGGASPRAQVLIVKMLRHFEAGWPFRESFQAFAVDQRFRACADASTMHIIDAYPMPPYQGRTKRVHMVVTPEEWGMAEALARQKGLTVSDIFRMHVRDAYAREFGDKPPAKPPKPKPKRK